MNEKPGWFHISKTSGNKRLARSMLLILCAAISLIFTGAFITYAVLKTVTPTATNVFQSDKNIRIKLDEPQWEDHGRSEALGYVPGQKIDKDPTVTLQADSVDSCSIMVLITRNLREKSLVSFILTKISRMKLTVRE